MTKNGGDFANLVDDLDDERSRLSHNQGLHVLESAIKSTALSRKTIYFLSEDERGVEFKVVETDMRVPFREKVAESLRAMVMGAQLEDARHLAQCYDRMRQESESLASCNLIVRALVVQGRLSELISSGRLEVQTLINPAIGDWKKARSKP